MQTQRRTFLKTAAATALGLQIIPRHVLGGAGTIPPSQKLNIAAIGAGGQAAADLQNMADENIVALCDVDDRRAAEMFNKFPQAKRYKDFRKMLDEQGEKLDAVLVGTPDHTHAVAAMAAMNRGKHVYCEKPLAHSVEEVRALRKVAKDRKLITQVGNQGHSSDSIRVFCEWIWDGAIGNVTEIHAGCDAFPETYCQIRNLEQVARERPAVPSEFDWELWQGPVAARPYHPAYAPWNWRGWKPYGSGTLGDWVCHVVDPVFWALDLDMPTTIRAETEGYDAVKHADTFPEGSKITFEFPAKGKRGAVKLVWFEGKCRIPRPAELDAGRGDVGTGAVVIGDRGKIVYGSHGAGGCRLIPEAKMQAYKRPEPKIPRVRGSHQQDWLHAIREGRQAGSPFEYGGRLTEVGLLGVIALRMPGQKLEYDEKAGRFTNNDDANRWLNPPSRSGWSLT
jgi:predicted dehydrogenase